MSNMNVANARNGQVLADDCRVASSFVARGLGLLRHSHLPVGQALLIRPCSSVHTFFMRFPIDVLFLDAQGRVIRIYHLMRPWRSSSIVRGAKQVLELPAGTAERTGTREGDVLVLEP